MTTIKTGSSFLPATQPAPGPSPETGPSAGHETEIQPGDSGMTRREFLNYAWLASLGILLAEMGGAVYLFAMPRFREGEFGGLFFLGIAADYTLEEEPEYISKGKFYMIRDDDGLLALYKVCTHLGCLVPWVPSANRFICPCHGSQFQRDGTYISGPAPRALDRFVIRLIGADGRVLAETDPEGYPVPVPDDNAEVVVDTSQRILGKPRGQSYEDKEKLTS